ncbi:hypothetical protein JVT61DRAFT_14647 [Boletus reticuloceps]|uniref:Uncharacterized protein n=1 Tax=Boletus reticuloceps TaxID=495285 RepID=A0A8I2YTK3_9AGAM|nr:hypothetical protein JVT61DRAFT_14647 [Boletus reticuloceps]
MLDLQLSQRRGRWPAWRAIIDGDLQGNTDHPWMEYQQQTPPATPTTSSPHMPEGQVSAPSPSRISLAPPTILPNKNTLTTDRDAPKGKAEATQPRPDKAKGKATAVQDVTENTSKPQPRLDKAKAKAPTVAERSDSSQSKGLARTSSKPKEDKGKGKKKQDTVKVVPEKKEKKPQPEPEDSEEETHVPAPSTLNKRGKASKVRSSPVGTNCSIPTPPSPSAPLLTSTDEPCERCAKHNTPC